jgi:hypothetical protein
LVKNQPLSLRRDQMEVLVDSAGVHDANLALFLQQLQHQGHFGHGGRVAYGTIAPLARAAPREGAARTAGPDATLMQPGALFLRYASDDLEAAERIKTALEASGVEVWFDKRRGWKPATIGTRRSGVTSTTARCSCRSSRAPPSPGGGVLPAGMG